MSEEAQNIDVEITEEKIEKAALPENRRVEEEVQENPVEVEINQEVAPVSEDQIKEDFEVSPKVEEKAKDQSDVEKRATLAQNRINKAVAQAKEFQRRELMAVQYANELKEQNQQLRQSQKTFNLATEMSLTIELNLNLVYQNKH